MVAAAIAEGLREVTWAVLVLQQGYFSGEHYTQTEHKIPILNSALCRG